MPRLALVLQVGDKAPLATPVSALWRFEGRLGPGSSRTTKRFQPRCIAVFFTGRKKR